MHYVGFSWLCMVEPIIFQNGSVCIAEFKQQIAKYIHCQQLNLVIVFILKYYVSRELGEIGRKMIYLEDIIKLAF